MKNTPAKTVDCRIVPALSSEQIEEVRLLFHEYADWLKIDLCFQGFDQELAALPWEYASPSGRLLLAMAGDQVAGCVALRRIEDGVCEMKRLFVRDTFRGQRIGRLLAKRLIDEAGGIGYTHMRLDTLPVMGEAISLYRSLGFAEIPPYRHNPVGGALFFELKL